MFTNLKSTPCEQLQDPGVRERFAGLHRPSSELKLTVAERLLHDVAEAKGLDLPIEDGAFRSAYSPQMLDVPMQKFLSAKTFKPNKSRLNRAVSRVRRLLHMNGTIPVLETEEAYKELMRDKEMKQAGLPTLLRKKDDLEALNRAQQCVRGKCPPAAVILHRGKDTTVVRPVWCLPIEWHIVEAKFFYPLQEHMLKKVRIYASDKAINRRAQIMSYISDPEAKTKLSLDYSKFDASVSTSLISVAFQLLREGFLLDDKGSKLWSRVETYFATSPFLYPDGNVYKGRRGGVPSGSMFTQIIDSVINAVLFEYIAEATGLRGIKYLCFGDDTWAVCVNAYHEVSLDSLAKAAAELGMVISIKKSLVVQKWEPVVFLGHWDTKQGRPLKDTLTKLVYPERWNKEMYTPSGLLRRFMMYSADNPEADVYLHPILVALSRAMQLGTDRYDPLVHLPGDNLLEEISKIPLNIRDIRELPGVLKLLPPSIATSYWRIRQAA